MDAEIVERNRKVALAVDEGLLDLDDEELLGLFSDQPFWQVGRNRYEGREGVLRIRGYARLLYPHGMERVVQAVLADEQRVVVQHAIRARTNNDTDYDNEYVKVYELAPDGRIDGVWEHLDSAYSATAFDLSAIAGAGGDRAAAGGSASAPVLGLTVDEVLTTTRAVRRRLDLERPVPRAVVEECLRLAF